MTKVIVEVKGGLVVGLYANDMNVEVMVVDRDSEGADFDEIMDKNEIIEFCGKEQFQPLNSFSSGILDEELAPLLD